MMFSPTHLLVSRSRKTPVQMIAHTAGFQLLTEPEWQQGREPAFELRPKQGVFCKGTLVVGYHIEPIADQVLSAQPTSQTVSAS